MMIAVDAAIAVLFLQRAVKLFFNLVIVSQYLRPNVLRVESPAFITN